MSPSISTTLKGIWRRLADKEYRDSFVASNIANTVASQINALREQRGWTQKDLAKRAGMAQSRISSLEDPNLENFEIVTLKRLASAFDVAVVVRFVPFSELASWTAELSENKLLAPDFVHDSIASKTAASSALSVQELKFSVGADDFSRYLVDASQILARAMVLNNVSATSHAETLLQESTSLGKARIRTESPAGIKIVEWASP